MQAKGIGKGLTISISELYSAKLSTASGIMCIRAMARNMPAEKQLR